MPAIRPAQPADLPAIAAVHEAAFPTPDEARLVRLLAERDQDSISLIAVHESEVIGHVLFSPATIEAEGRAVLSGLGLAPVAVVPALQNRGIGSALIREGLEHCRELAMPFVVVLGAPAYYSRFGFVPASHYNLTGEFGGGDAFQMQWLCDPAKDVPGGFVRYAPAFHELFGSTDA